MATNSHHPASNMPEPNPPEPIQPDSGELSSELAGRPSAEASSVGPSGSKPSNDQPADVPSQNGYSAKSSKPAPPNSGVAGTPPPAKKSSFDSFPVNSSPVRRTTPSRTNQGKTASAKKNTKQSVSSKSNARNGQARNGQARNGQSRSVQPRIPLFFGVGIVLSLVAGGLKAMAAALADGYLYSLPWMGGFLRSIELAEISNLVVFALLAGGIGAATIWLPHRWNPWAKIGLLLAVSPFVFSASYIMQQRLWIQKVAERSDISYPEAQQITNDFLKRQTGSSGFWGFYPYSTEVADLPTSRASLEKQSASNPSKLLTKELSSYDDPRADLVAYVFERVGWLMRLMYMAIATITALIYYFKGREWVENRRTASYESVNSDANGHQAGSQRKRL